jgi:hypothetical protein
VIDCDASRIRLRRINPGAQLYFGRNNFSNVFDLLLDFTNLRMHVTDQIMLGPRQLFNAVCHFMQLFQRRFLTR